MLKLVTLCFFIALGFKLSAQKIELKLTDSIIGEIDYFYVDNIGNIYLSNQDIMFKLDSKKYDTLFSSSLKSITPQYIEASKNFRVLIFDKDRSTIQFLDNTLSSFSDDLNLFNLDLVQPILVCESFNGNAFWILDAGTLRLLKVNDKFEVINQIDNLSFLKEMDELPTKMMEYNDKLYLFIPNQKILVFDAFGTFLKSYPFKYDDFSVHKNLILAYKKSYFDFISLPFFDLKFSYLFDLNPVKAFQVSVQKLYVLNNSGIFIYQITSKN